MQTLIRDFKTEVRETLINNKSKFFWIVKGDLYMKYIRGPDTIIIKEV